MAIIPAPLLRVLVTFSGTTKTDITADILRLTITRGRARERETMSPGRCQIELWNRKGNYDPDNSSGLYYPNIRPNKIVEVLADVASTSTPFTMGSSTMGGGDAFGGGGTTEVALFTGRLEGGPLTFDEGGLQPKVTWNAIDASKRLNRDRSTTGYGTSGDLTGERVAAVLDGATPTWPASERDIMPGTRTVQAETGEAGRYDYMVTVAASEFGAFFISKEGWAIFRDSTWDPAPATPILGSGGGEYPFSRITIVDDEAEIFNAVTVTAPTLADQVQEDAGSQAEFGRADLAISSILDNTGDMSDVALSFLNAYAGPRRRIASLRVDRIAADWGFYLTKELQDRVTVRHRPIYGGTFEQESVIQGIGIEVEDSENWAVTWNLSPPLSVVSNPNLLTENQSSFESVGIDWTVTSGDFLSLQRVNGAGFPFVGEWCLEAKPGSPGFLGYLTNSPTTTAPVVVGETYRASAWARNFWGSGSLQVFIDWRNSGGSVLSTIYSDVFGSYYSGDTEWHQGSVQGVAPASSAYATVTILIVDVYGESHPHYLDAIELRHVGL